MSKQQFPDLIKAGLKVGDTVHSYLYGEGKVIEITSSDSYPIVIRFEHGNESFTAYGMYEKSHLIPSITMQPWNPIAGEPFPFQKWQPTNGEWCAFWDNGDTSFVVAIFESMSDGKYMFKDSGAEWDNCTPRSEAYRIFGVNESE